MGNFCRKPESSDCRFRLLNAGAGGTGWTPGVSESLGLCPSLVSEEKKLDTENRAFVARDPDSCQPQVFGLLPLSAASFLIW